MKNYTESTYGESIADEYDSWFGCANPQMVDRLTELALGGKVLELGIGTGRVALPLRQKGIDIHGIDSSPSMVEKMRFKTEGDEIPVRIASFAQFEVTEKYNLIFVVFNTFFALQSQKEQVTCFQSVLNALIEGGIFLIEAFVPDLHRFDRGQTMRASEIADDHVRIECSRHDLVSQTVTSQTVKISETGTRLYPIKIRYAWPSEMDLMAELAGLVLTERWGGWNKEPFSSESKFHVSIYKKTN